MGTEPQVLFPACHINGQHTVEALSAGFIAFYLRAGISFSPTIRATVLLADAKFIIEQQPVGGLEC
jgi:hypothetical protein